MKCKCGCGAEVKEGNQYIYNHHRKGKHLSEDHKRKISENHRDQLGENNHMYGKHHSEETKQKISDNHADFSGENHPFYGKHHSHDFVGENNGNWQGGITPENIKIRNSDEYGEWRSLVFQRDNFTCKLCNVKGGDLNAHHILPFSDFHELRMELSNGITLCKDCHNETKGKEYDYVNQFVWTLNNNQELIDLLGD